MKKPTLTIRPNPYVITNTAAAPAGVKGISLTITSAPVQSPKVQIGR